MADVTEFEPDDIDDFDIEDDWDDLPPRRRGRWLRGFLLVFGGLVVIGIVVAVVAGLYVKGQINGSASGPDVQLTIPKGSSATAIAEILEDKEVVSSATVFRLYVRVKGVDGFQAGDYTLRRRQPYSQVIGALRKGPEITMDRITIPEGFVLTQIAERVGRLPGRSAEKFLELANSGQVRSEFQPDGNNNLEGLLLPDTFFVTEKDDERAILERMVSAFDQEATSMGIREAATRFNLTPYEVVTVASMVEREAKVDGDRGKVASVIYNRLRKKMTLGIDATLLYALKGDAVELSKRPNQPSPYNTRLIPGLPPTPIASPGRASLQAAIAPEETDFIYYVLTSADGYHAFTASAAEFNRLVADARRKGLL